MAIQKSEQEVKYEVKEKCGVIATRKGKAGESTLELRYISWNGGAPKYDIRPWYEKDGKECCQKGITMSGDELIALGNLIKKLEEE